MAGIAGLSAPVPLSEQHEAVDFRCGEPALDEWLIRRAKANQISGASRTYVVCSKQKVVGYYAVTSGSIGPDAVPGKVRRKMPNPIPVAVLARLAVDLEWHSKGLGRALFRDAAMRVSNAADAIGIRGIVVHAISEEAKRFYLGLGFTVSPADAMTLVVTLADARAALG